MNQLRHMTDEEVRAFTMNEHPPQIASARVMQVIETQSRRGEGKSAFDPIRVVTQYWNFDGGLLAEFDPHVATSGER